VGSNLIGIGIVIALIVLAAIVLVMVSGTKRLCPHCHTMMPKKRTACPKCGKAIPLNY
jgi:hypothetical protein